MRLVLGLLAVSCVLFFEVAEGAASGGPNIVLVIGDDHGWPYYGFEESPQILTNGSNVQAAVQTPNLDALAATGVTFHHGYASGSVCTPSLQTLLSAHGHEWSQWQLLLAHVRSRVPISAQERLERRENRYAENLPRMLARYGYRTWEGGKMWAGLLADTGFQEGLATFLYPEPFYGSGGWGFGRDGWNVTECGSTASGSESCPALAPFRTFLDHADGRPFFAWFAPMLPHIPYDAPPEYRADFEALGLAAYEVDHLSNIRWFDEVVGELLAELEIRGLRDDTLLIYASDNGWGMGFQNFAGTGHGKGTLYDLGFRTPIIFNQPGTVPAGIEFDDFVSFSDLPATILDYASIPLPDNSVGQSLRTRIHGGAPIEREGLVMFSRAEGGAYVDDQWRYLQFADGHEELYRIDLDPFEQTELASSHPEKLAQYAAIVDARRLELASMLPDVPVNGQLFDEAGDALAGAHLRLSGGLHTQIVLSGEDGRFAFAPFEPIRKVRLRGSKGVRPLLLDATSLAPLSRPFTLPGLFVPALARARRTVTAPLGGEIRGQLTTPDGVPIPDARIRARASLPGRDLALTTVSQGDGGYALQNLAVANDYVVTIHAKGYRRLKVSGIAIDSPSNRLEIDLALTPR